MSLLHAEFKFKVTKDCVIFNFENYTIVYYKFNVGDKQFKVIEIELNKTDFNLLAEAENFLSQALPGFNPTKVINKSKFEMVRELYDNAAQ